MNRVPLFSSRPVTPPPRSLPPVEVARGGRALAADLVRLADLQVKLFAADWRAASSRTVGGAVALVAGVAIAVLCVPVLLAAMGLGLAALGLPLWAGLLIVGGTAAVAGVALAWFGWKRLSTAASAFDRSRSAAVQNVSWVKRSLAREPHPPSRPEPAGPTNDRPR